MAIYGLETETTVHIKGMQVGDSQPDTEGGDLISNAIFVLTEKVYHRYIGNNNDEIAIITNAPSLQGVRLFDVSVLSLTPYMSTGSRKNGNVIFTNTESEYDSWSKLENTAGVIVLDFNKAY